MKNCVFTKETDYIYRLKVPFEDLYTSVFLIETDKGYILVDCATDESSVDEYIVPGLRRIGIELKDISYLVITHNHGDHAGGLNRILEYNPNIPVITTACEFSRDIYIYAMPGHTRDCLGVFDIRSGTLISGDGVQGDGVSRYRRSIESNTDYFETIDKIRKDERIIKILFSHAYEPWNKDCATGREEIEKVLNDCIKSLKE